MPFLKRNFLGICGLLFLVTFIFKPAIKSVLADTWLPMKLSVSSNDELVDRKSFSVPVDVTVYWDCNLNGDKYVYGSFLITDSKENAIVKADRLNITRSGSFNARTGEVYTISATGNSGYDNGHNTHFGAAQGTVKYLYRYEWQLYDNTFSGVWQNSFLYLPEKIGHTGQYSYDKSMVLNKRTDIGVRNYDIPIWFQAEIGDKPDIAQLEIDPGIRIYKCNANGELVREPLKLNLTGYNRKKHDGFFILPANFSFLVDINTGKYTFSKSGAASGFTCHYKIEYMLDNAAPNIPESPSPIRYDNVKKINNSFHTKQNQVELAWAVPRDNASVFKEKTIISGVKDFQVLTLDNVKNSSIFSDWLPQPSVTLALEEGEYSIKVKARDCEGNESDYSAPFNLVIDHSINQVSLEDIPKPIELQPQNGVYNIRFTWSPVQDNSGTQYQVALTNSPLEPNGGWDTVDSNQYTFYNRTPSENILYGFIRAIDGVGNTSKWVHTEGFNIWSPPAAFSVASFAGATGNQAQYKVELDFNNIEVAKYVIERVGSKAVNPVELTYNQLAQSGFKYVDNINLQKHGQYQYIVYTQSTSGVNSVKTISSFVKIPNVPAAGVDIIIKNSNSEVFKEQFALNNALLFEISPKQDCEGDEIRFRLCYKNLDTVSNQTFYHPYVFQTDPISIKELELNDGNYEFWMEYQEFSDGLSCSEVASTPHHTVTIY